MILVCGVMADRMIELRCARLDDLGYDYLFFDQLRFPGRYDLAWQLDAAGVSGSVYAAERRIDLADVTGVYVRYVRYSGGPANPAHAEFDDHERELAQGEYQLALMQLLDLLPCRVVNRARASTSNDSKVYQGFLAQSFGLAAPRTLVTTDPEAARAFYDACGEQVIYKSLSGVRSIVRRLTADDLGERLERVRNCPTQFQGWVAGVDIRVHVVGEQIFATQVESEAEDYRYAGRSGASLNTEAIELPAAIGDACIAMTHALGLELSGIDLRRTPEGAFYCFEVNPSPGFIFYERATGQPISTAVAELLRHSPAQSARMPARLPAQPITTSAHADKEEMS
jgi:glutathione synthase/RimK-type ligase-like ATP-grasp enzyme